MIHLRRLLTLMLLPVTLALTAAEPARAGTYKVHGCRLPSGAVAPANGWVPSGVGSWVTSDNSCAGGGSLYVALSSMVAHNRGDQARWELPAPANTRIVTFAGNRAARTGAGQPYGTPGVLLHADGQPLEVCTQYGGCPSKGSFSGWNAGGNAFTFGGLDASRIGIVADCGGGSGGVCPAEDPKAVGSLYRAEVTLSDTLDPQPSTVSGGLVESGPHHATEWVTVNATDQGAGIYRGVIEVDGAEVVNQVLDGNGGKCADARPGEADAYEFLDVQPCKLSLSASLSLDTTRLSDGAHTIRVRLVDAAGNTATAFGPSPFEVRNQPQPGTGSPTGSTTTFGVSPAAHNSQHAAEGAGNSPTASQPPVLRVSFARNGRRALTTSYGARVVVRGRLLTGSGHGIAGAPIYVIGRKKSWSTTTAPDGTFSMTLRHGLPSQTLRIAYRAPVSAASAAASASLRLKVRAGLRLSVSPRKVRNRQAITFRGRLLGAPVPRRGKLIELQVRFPSGWRTFATVRANRRGTFRYRYRFVRSYQPITYRFRVRSRGDGSHPYETGSSRAVSVRVR